jgi:hypothetical protein
VSFVASPQASSTSIEAHTTAKPFFDGQPIQGFFNTIRKNRSFADGIANRHIRPLAALQERL